MIIMALDSLVVGQRAVGLFNVADGDGGTIDVPEQPFVVLREATYEEYEAFSLSHGASPAPSARAQAYGFFEISVD